MIIALTGAAGAGKSTAAEILADRHGFARVRFAGPLKAMVRAFLAQAGVEASEIERMIEGDRKEAPAPEFLGASPRKVMQTLGTEWGRDLIAPGLWVEGWKAGARAALARGAPGVVVEDCRFPNEAEAVQALGGLIVRIDRPGAVIPLSGHGSEKVDLPRNATILNDGSRDELGCALDRVLADLLRAAA
ncbi:deoxynucleotide monophosphate kinase [Methylobacterium gnaphalii]|uniref:Deoxynucleotide monophosphate kinase n=1 Tax=Methylobacterium gnaphalii TaxID=1010610 RepID=A0A512JP64_9HYPH|nr:deoxynucleotide monophosphate kinase [Methylobacterium gnaphalii]GEP11750.1 hypothetical protein MGN01_35950 [Methylobacterium gnaphalii]GJD69428.1 hypothetical protein MMMDOFMJ_2359 [Methylobacterium gnaphalii]GLS49615.1 hypothetical protein GCM10007885_24640 [Methylobacterium gnaphalii]